jgi:Tfp pilus assembly protein PilO
MDEFLSAELWSQQWHFIVPLMLLSVALGWWLRSTVVKREIVSLEKTNDTLEQRLKRAQENEASLMLVCASLQADLADLKAQIRKLKDRMPDEPELKKLRLPMQTSTSTVSDLSEAIAEIRQMVGQYEATIKSPDHGFPSRPRLPTDRPTG